MTEPQLDPETLRGVIARELTGARRRTSLLTDSVDEADLVRQHSPLMSPLVWDLAHIANQEELWLLREVGGREPLHPEIDPLYDAFEHPRSKRPTLPLLPPAEARAYGHEVRGRVLDLLDRAPFAGARLLGDGFAFGMIAQHEVQHDETMLITHQIRAGAPVLDVLGTGAVRQPGGDLGRPVEAVAVDEPVPGQDLLGLGIGVVGHHRGTLPQPDPAGVHRGGQALRVDQLPGFGQAFAERLHELAHRRELGRGPGRLAGSGVARHRVVVLLGSVHQDQVLHGLSRPQGCPAIRSSRGAFTGDVGAAGPDRTPRGRIIRAAETGRLLTRGHRG